MGHDLGSTNTNFAHTTRIVKFYGDRQRSQKMILVFQNWSTIIFQILELKLVGGATTQSALLNPIAKFSSAALLKNLSQKIGEDYKQF